MNAKRKIIGICLLCIILVGTLCSCVDFEGELVQTNEVKLEYILGDVDLNGFHEKVVLGKDEFSLYNGSRLVKSYKLEEDMEYISVTGMYGDINGDSMSDIIVLLKGQDNIYDVFVLNGQNEYELQSFPMELNGEDKKSGISADIKTEGEFIYKITVGQYQLRADVSALYMFSTLDVIGVENIKARWKKIEESSYQGQVKGITDLQIIDDSEGITFIRLTESIVGGDEQAIGDLIMDLYCNDNGELQIRGVALKMRRIDYNSL